MTPKAEVLTLTKQGLANFILELKRTQIRGRSPFEAWAKRKCKAAKKLKTLSQKKLHELYVKAVDAGVSEWEQRQRNIVDKKRQEAKDKQAAADAASYGDMLEVTLLTHSADGLADTFNSVRFYIGELNRDVNEGRVAAYRTDIEEGKWWFTPDPIVITDDGGIINGQHRLLAVERALSEGLEDAKAPSFVVVWGVDKKAAILMDEARRTSTDRRDIAIRYANANR